jgi:Ca-activated chloride channel family protein
MVRSNSDIAHGHYLAEIEVSILARADSPSDVTLFEVEDNDGNQFVVGGVADRVNSLRIGETYRIEHGLGIDPGFNAREAFPDQFEKAASHDCPECGSTLTFEPGHNSPPDAVSQALNQQGREGLHLVITEESELQRLSANDDWQPFRETKRTPRTPHHHYQCSECSLSIPEGKLARYLEHGGRPVEAEPERADLESPMADASESLGMATGGAKDVDNFRDNISEGYLPGEDALTTEGLFYDYYFDTGDDRDGRHSLFYPSYSTAVTNHPLTDRTEHYLTVGLNSTISVEEFERRQLNLVAVLDVSGSMGSQFDQYYYDESGQRRSVDSPSSETKMAAATESLAALTTHLEADDRFGVVLYNSREHVAKALSLVAETDMDAIRGHIRDVTSGGGTNMSAGLETAIDLLGAHEDADATQVENRIVFLTDMMPNTGATGKNAITATVEEAAARGIHTTFIGMGLDENPELAESLSKIRGANHYFVHSDTEFKQRLDDEFEYMVTPLVFDLQLELDGDVGIDAIYGSPNADRSSGELMSVSTLFPSPTTDGETRGGVILLRLDGAPSEAIDLVASWEEIDGTIESDRVHISPNTESPEHFETSGIRKAVCLARYAGTLQEWLTAVRSTDDWTPMNGQRQGQWERDSEPLHVPEQYREQFRTIKAYVDETAADIDDELGQEVSLLDTLIEYQSRGPEHDLSDQAVDRLRDLAELAPTSNGELAEAWGTTTGSEVHAYLESELEEYYRRDENHMLRPTEEAMELVQIQP